MFEPIKCELTKNDINDFCLFSMQIERIQELNFGKNYVKMLVIILILNIVITTDYVLCRLDHYFLMMTFILWIIWVLLFMMKYSPKTFFAKSMAKKLCKVYDDSNSWNYEIYISDDFIVSKDSQSESKWKYSSLVDVYKTESSLYVYVSPYVALIIPKRAFNNGETFNDVYSFLRDKIAAFSPNNQQEM